MATVLCALLAAIIWNLVTWWLGLPSSSSHALIGGLCGSAVASAGGDWSVLKWDTGLMPKVVVPMFTSPVIGFVARRNLDGTALCFAPSFHAPHRAQDLREIAARQRRVDGP